MSISNQQYQRLVPKHVNFLHERPFTVYKGFRMAVNNTMLYLKDKDFSMELLLLQLYHAMLLLFTKVPN